MDKLIWLLAIVFTVLKFTAVITWPWIWVLSPLWIGYGFALVLLVIFGGIAATVAAVVTAVYANPQRLRAV